MSQCCGFIIGHAAVRLEKESKIILHKGTYKKCKHFEGNKIYRTYRKCKHLESNTYPLKKGKLQAATLGNKLVIAKSDQTCTKANMLAAFPLTTARDRHWWNQWQNKCCLNFYNTFVTDGKKLCKIFCADIATNRTMIENINESTTKI